jgi:hypothetical protein
VVQLDEDAGFAPTCVGLSLKAGLLWVWLSMWAVHNPEGRKGAVRRDTRRVGTRKAGFV